ncbi:IQ motif and SEC7 domain-containing protein 1-like [Limulus polyphemus]|uniref:IQ motif and SEC7 domain-containing protein 1-like n=1 Tax=Limulus polyphemus TaxID=6850 RepID=A0ABM1SI97_LIMPO|nr:IQ motif and SEC7 domain-containing protein 1-like [Limulus polyphemus]
MTRAYQDDIILCDLNGQSSGQLPTVDQEFPDLSEDDDDRKSKRSNLSGSILCRRSSFKEDVTINYSCFDSGRLCRSYSCSPSYSVRSGPPHSKDKRRFFTKVHFSDQEFSRVETIYIDNDGLLEYSVSSSTNQFCDKIPLKDIGDHRNNPVFRKTNTVAVSTPRGAQTLANRSCVRKSSSSSFHRSTWRDHLVTDMNMYGNSLDVCYRQQWAVGPKTSRFENNGYNLNSRSWFREFQPSSSPSFISVTSAPCYSVRNLASNSLNRSLATDRHTEELEAGEYLPGRRRNARSLSPERFFRRLKNSFRKTGGSRTLRTHEFRAISLRHVEESDQSCMNTRDSTVDQKLFDTTPYEPGPPLKQLRSYSVDTHNSSHPTRNSRQRASSGNVGLKKTPVRRVDDEALKRSRSHSNQYELSQDLLDKQVEMLERKYGGVCARHAALTIQRAFRKYCMVKRFQELAHPKSEKRLSRRLYTFDLEGKDWMVYAGSLKSSGHRQYTTGIYNPGQEMLKEGFQGINSTPQSVDAVVKSNFAALYRELSETLETENGRPLRPTRSLSMREKKTSYLTDSDNCIRSSPNCVYTKESTSYPSAQVFTVHNNLDMQVVSSGERLHPQNSLQSGLPGESSALNDSLYHVPPSSIPKHTMSSSTDVKHINSSHSAHPEPMMCLVPNQIPTPGAEHYHIPREPLPTEGSTINFSGMDEGLVRDSAGRRSVNNPLGMTKKPQEGLFQRTSIRSSDAALGRKYNINQKKIPPRVPRRTSSISNQEHKSTSDGVNSPTYSVESFTSSSEGSMGYDITQQYSTHPDDDEMDKVQSKKCNVDASPIWKRKSLIVAEQVPAGTRLEDKRLSNISENSEDSLESTGYSTSPPISVSDMQSFTGITYSDSDTRTSHDIPSSPLPYKSQISEIQKKRQYRIGLNLFNKKPERGIRYLIQRSFLEGSPKAVARFLISRKGLSKHNIGEYLGNLQCPFNMAVLGCFVEEMDLAGMQVDVALRKFQTFFRMPSGVDDGSDLDRHMLTGIYERIKASEFKPGSDHVTQVMKVQQTIVGKKPNLALPHRRLVCYCRLYEIYDINKKERPGVHQREIFLFNDMIMVTKIFNKKKNSVTYTFRQSFSLCGMNVTLFEAPYYPHGIRLSQRVDDKVLITFNARNEHDRSKFVEDLKESILEMDEMESMRIEAELEKQKSVRSRGGDNRDSGVADMEIVPASSKESRQVTNSLSANLKRSALSNSLLDLHEQQMNKPVRRGSAGSLDSGMSVSFQSSAASTVSRDSLLQTVPVNGANKTVVDSGVIPVTSAGKSSNTPGFLGGLFSKKGKSSSRINTRKNAETSTM